MSKKGPAKTRKGTVPDHFLNHSYREPINDKESLDKLLEGRRIIGIDETNPGFSINKDFNKPGFPLVIAGYCFPPGTDRRRAHRKGKRGLFSSENPPSEEALEDADRYLRENSGFAFSLIPPHNYADAGVIAKSNLRAKAISAIALNLIREQEVDPRNLVIVCDNMNSITERVLDRVEGFLNYVTNADAPAIAIKHGEQLAREVKVADRVAYHLTGLKLWRHTENGWPFPEKEVSYQAITS